MSAVTPEMARFLLTRLMQAGRDRGPFAGWDELTAEVFPSEELAAAVAAVRVMTVEQLALLACQDGPARR